MTAELVARPEARPILEGWLARHGTLIDAAASSPDAEHLRGRGRVLSVRPRSGGDRWVVRHYHRGGAVATLLGDRYLRWSSPRPFREFHLLRALRTMGVPAVEAVGAAVYRAGPFYCGDLVTTRVPGAVDLARVLFGAAQLDRAGGRRPRTAGAVLVDRQGDPAPGAAMAAAGRLVRLLHEGGVVHPDLNLKNILIVESPEGAQAYAVDLDRARVRPQVGEGSRRRMLERFERSLRKWEGATGIAAPAGWLEAFRAGYAGSTAEGRGAASSDSASR